MCRKYGFLRSRVLLYRQDELANLERTLVDLDDLDLESANDKKEPIHLMSRKIDDARKREPPLSRKTLIQAIDDKLKEYGAQPPRIQEKKWRLMKQYLDDVIRRIQMYVSLRAPKIRDWQSFNKWMENEKPLMPQDERFLEHQMDFVALADNKECGWLDGFVEDTLKFLLPRTLRTVSLGRKRNYSETRYNLLTTVQTLMRSRSQGRISYDPYVDLISKRRTDVIVRVILTLATAALLVGPSAVLFLVNGHAKLKILLIMVFVLLFSLALSVFTKARRHEMLAATATYVDPPHLPKTYRGRLGLFRNIELSSNEHWLFHWHFNFFS